MKKRKELVIHLTNRWLYTLISIGILVIVGVAIYAISPGIVPNPGHNINEISVPSGCLAGQFLKYNGTDWVCATTKEEVSSIKFTTAMHDGNFGGYQAMNNWIQNNGCSGYHVCDNTEVISLLRRGIMPSWTGWAWINTAVASNDGSYVTYDCAGWITNQAGIYGNYIQGGNLGKGEVHYTACSAQEYVACCK